jgi:hypothetical protein
LGCQFASADPNWQPGLAAQTGSDDVPLLHMCNIGTSSITSHQFLAFSAVVLWGNFTFNV